MNILKTVGKLRYKINVIKDVLFNDAKIVKASSNGKGIDEINSRNMKIRELESKREKEARADETSSSQCSLCGKKEVELHKCVRCGRAVCDECATFVPESESDFQSGYYCEKCW